jgi:dihydrofolate reductase
MGTQQKGFEMRKIVAGLFISLDGVVESPDKWHFPYLNDEMGEAVQAQMNAADAILLGRRTYEEFASYWPQQPSGDPFADHLNSTPKYVVSSTLDNLEWQNSSLITGDVAAELTKLKEQPGRDISMTGSGTLVRWLLDNNLLDELRLLVHPLVVGSGKRLFRDGAQVPLTLAESRTFSTGVLSLLYTPAGV